jgi:NAD(P)-dependent dehydrogenase (short-subunit alcohol dehydrogenase family)
MGESLSRHLVQEGWNVAMADVNQNENLLKELGEKAAFFRCDVSDYDSQAKMFQGAWDRFGQIDALCANAGIVDRRYVILYPRSQKDADEAMKFSLYS